MRRIILATSLILSTGCAGSYKAAYVTGAVTKEFTTTAYSEYSEQFNAQLDECDPANNEAVNSKTQLDECMGPAFEKSTHDKIVEAIALYYKAAEALTESLILVDGDPDERKAAVTALFETALELLERFPGSENLVKRLKSLAGRK